MQPAVLEEKQKTVHCQKFDCGEKKDIDDLVENMWTDHIIGA